MSSITQNGWKTLTLKGVNKRGENDFLYENREFLNLEGFDYDNKNKESNLVDSGEMPAERAATIIGHFQNSLEHELQLGLD